MEFYNAKGHVSNEGDDAGGLERGLASAFDSVQVDVVGAVALLTAT